MRRSVVSAFLGLLVALSMTPRALVLAHETPGIGATINYIGPDGAAAGTITVTVLTAPYEAYDPSSPPQRGANFVRLDVTIANSGTRPLEVDPNDISLQDSDGFLYGAGGLFLGSEVTATDPELTYQELPAGMEISGWVGFEVITGATLAGVFYMPDSDRLILLADLTAEASGQTTTTTTTGGAAATLVPTESAAAEPTRSLTIGTDPAVPTETPVATTSTGTGTTGTTTGTVGIAGNSYTSPNFGYIVNWDETVWTSEERTDPGFDRLLLENGASQLYIEGTDAFGGDPAACLAGNVEVLSAEDGVTSYVPATDNAGNPLGMEDEISAVGIYIVGYTFSDGSTGELVNYIECRSMAPAVAADVVITNILLLEDFNTEASAQYEVTSRLVLPGPGEMVPSEGPGHIARGEAHDPYTTSPPTSGPHIGAELAPWGVSAVQIEDEVQVHNLEHGGVMLQYACACPEVVALLESFADPATGYPVKVIAAPYAEMDADVTLTAWGHILSLSEAEVTGPTVLEFIEAYVDRGPERPAAEAAELAAWRATQ
ncbi:MAG: DUF3105 domain-containing protein [Chloroflexota bacterium]|nr:DUF3105 domain-containing protein [Chloroflexota bacterium]